GLNELLRGFFASSLRDAPYAGLFVVFCEGIKCETSVLLPSTSGAYSAGIHGFSTTAAGAIATMATHPFGVIKVRAPYPPSEDRYHGFLRTVSTVWRVSCPHAPKCRVRLY
ncbi:hypothetical protein FIBSPDRAFT_763208, partial [Athelia psychrophila]